MIVEVLLSGFIKLVRAILEGVLPTDQPPDMSAAAMVVPAYGFFNAFLPVSEALDLAVLSVQVLVVLAGGWVVMWVLARIKGLPFL